MSGMGSGTPVTGPISDLLPPGALWYEVTQADVVLLIYSSLWLGALAWEVFVTTPFDYRLIVETNWKSFLSAIHSLAYLLSRYATLVFITIFVCIAGPRESTCQDMYTPAAGVFAVSVCSINLVFLLRTCAIWNMRWVAVVPLTASWLLIFGFSVAFITKVKVQQVGGFCIFDTSGFYVGAILVVVAVFGLLNLIYTLRKLNNRHWKSVLLGLLPQSRPNLDSDDVSVMLVERTTVFFVIQLVLLIIIAVVFFSPSINVPYRLMNIVAFKAVTSSVAGKIFRKSWRLTRDVNNGNFTRPPSYFQGWAEERDESLSRRTSTLKTKGRSGGDDDVYVEGDFGSKTPAQMFASKHSPSQGNGNGNENGTGGGGAEGEEGEKSPETVVDMESQVNHAAIYEEKGQMEDSNQMASTVLVPLPVAQDRSLQSVYRAGTRRGSKRPLTDPVRNAKGKDRQALENRPVSMMSDSTTLKAGATPNQVSWVDNDEPASTKLTVAEIFPQHQASREDLNLTPTRSRLWLDSRAERARMEAAASALGSPGLASASLLAGASSDTASQSYEPSTSSSSRTSASRPGKRAILDNANEARNKLKDQWWQSASKGEMQMSSTTASSSPLVSINVGDAIVASSSRASFLPSPAIVSRDNTSKLDRRNFDFDAIRQTLQDMSVPSPRRRQGSRSSLSFPTSPAHSDIDEESKSARAHRSNSGEKAKAERPKTAPSRPSQDSIPQMPKVPSPSKESVDPIEAFRRVIEEDAIDRKNGVEDASRPRTSRGGRIGPFGQTVESNSTDKDGSIAIGLGIAGEEAASDERPAASHGLSTVKPFGCGAGERPISAIEEQYQKLAAYVNEEDTTSDINELKQVESRSTMEHLA